nr:hypothetical protein BaRGS_032310 [Batillaria attramentaria]
MGLAFVCNQSFPASSYPDLRYLDASGSGMTSDDLTDNFYLIDLTLSACVGLLGLLAAIGTPIPGDVNVGIAILVLPLNSALNPFLYTLNIVLERRRKASEARMIEQMDDELLCDLTCPEGCRCQGLAFVCNQSFPASSYPDLRYLDASASMVHCFAYMTVRRISIMFDSHVASNVAIARRLTTIVLSDLLCWFPVGLIGLLALTGTPVSSEVHVAMAIFVLPLNSALNPFLYTVNVLREKRSRAAKARMLEQLARRVVKERRVRSVGIMTDDNGPGSSGTGQTLVSEDGRRR